MRRIPFFVLDAFTQTPFAGNPAGVFLDAEQLTSDEMQKLAGEVSLESAFVLPGGHEVPGQGGVQTALSLRFWTHASEIPLCGHATVSCLVALARSRRVPYPGELFVGTPVGPLKVELRQGENGSIDVTLFQNPPQFGTPLDEPDVAAVARALGCTPDQLRSTDLPVQRVSTGTPFLFAAVESRAVVDQAPGSPAAVTQLSHAHEVHGIYVFVLEQTPEGAVTYGRNFDPAAGLDEDPVTGSASGALGCFLFQHGKLEPDHTGAARLLVQQGFAMGRGGTLGVVVQVRDNEIASVCISGTATLLAEGTFTL